MSAKAYPCGLWYMELQRRDLRGDEDDTIAKLQVWADEAPTEDERSARYLFINGFHHGMKWSGVWR